MKGLPGFPENALALHPEKPAGAPRSSSTLCTGPCGHHFLPREKSRSSYVSGTCVCRAASGRKAHGRVQQGATEPRSAASCLAGLRGEMETFSGTSKSAVLVTAAVLPTRREPGQAHWAPCPSPVGSQVGESGQTGGRARGGLSSPKPR